MMIVAAADGIGKFQATIYYICENKVLSQLIFGPILEYGHA